MAVLAHIGFPLFQHLFSARVLAAFEAFCLFAIAAFMFWGSIPEPVNALSSGITHLPTRYSKPLEVNPVDAPLGFTMAFGTWLLYLFCGLGFFIYACIKLYRVIKTKRQYPKKS